MTDTIYPTSKNFFKGNFTLKGSPLSNYTKQAFLQPNDRMNAVWKYSLLDDSTFYAMHDRGASIQEILEYCKLTNGKIKGTLF